MIRDDTRQTIRFIIWVIIIAILFYIGSIFVFYRAGSNSRGAEQQMKQVVNQKTPIKSIEQYYHLDRGTSSYALAGTDAHGKGYYLIYLPKTKKAFLYKESKGITAKKLKQRFNRNSSHQSDQIKEINLGWYQKKPTWEISYQKNNGTLGYVLYDFHSGKEINEVDNL